MEKLSAPPGFISHTSFLLKKIQRNEETRGSTTLRQASKQALRQEPTEIMADVSALKRSLGSRPWILYDQSSDNWEKSESDKPDEVAARLLPRDLKTEVLEEAPVFYPTEEEFNDTLAFITSIRQRAEPHGICRIVPPSSWKPPCVLEEKTVWEKSTFATQVQLFGRIQNQNQKNKRAKGDDAKCNAPTDDTGYCRIEHGPEFTLKQFKKYVDNFKNQHFSMKDKISVSKHSSMSEKASEPSVRDIESEYRQLVENPDSEIRVLCRHDLDSRDFRSGFPSVFDPVETPESKKYLESGWNLNNTPRLPGSLLSLEDCKASSVSAPRLRIGMCFSSQFWTVEKHHFYSICYMHLGAPRVWYVVPGRYCFKFEATMRKFFPDSSVEEHKVHHKLTRITSPFAFKADGVPVQRCIQNPREFIIIFPGSYYSGFGCGFNCSETVNFAPLDWLPHGQIAIELHREKQEMLISYDKLLLGAAREAVRAQWESSLLRKNTPDNLRWKDACGKDGLLSKALKTRIKQEKYKRGYLSNPWRMRPMDKDFDAKNKRECCICFCDLHLSAIQCLCSVAKYSCLNHAKQLCSCSWGDKIFLFRYTIDELTVLLEALDGKLSAVYRWARQNLNFSLYTSISGESVTLNSYPEERNKKQDKLVDDVKSSKTRNVTLASIRAEVKTRVRAKALKYTAKLSEETVVSIGKTEEKSSMRTKNATDDLMEAQSVSSSSESDDDEDYIVDDDDDIDDDDYDDDDGKPHQKSGSKPGSSKISALKRPSKFPNTSASK